MAKIPIIVSFFTEERIHALKSETLRNLLDSVVFEPGRYLEKVYIYIYIYKMRKNIKISKKIKKIIL